MGNSRSTQVENSFYNRLAYQVIHVVKESPADKAGLMPYFDFLTFLPPIRTFTNSPLPYDEFVRDALARQPNLELMVFNCATARMRKVNLQPARYGSGPLDLTGFIVRAIIISEAISQVEHVQDVSIGTPAFNVGLVPNFDYIIATDDGNCFDMHQIIRAHNPNDCLRIYVIDIFLKQSRVVQVPGISILGERKFGCTLASGYLHRIPSNKMAFYLTRESSGNSPKHIDPIDARRVNSTECPLNREPIFYHDPEHDPHDDSECCTSHDHSGHEHHHHGHGHGSRSRSSTGSHGSSSANGTGHVKRKKKKAVNKSPIKTQPSTEPVDPNSCLFITRLQLDDPKDNAQKNGDLSNGKVVTKVAMPISVQIPKDIVTNVVADLVRYQREHQEHPVVAKSGKEEEKTPLLVKKSPESQTATLEVVTPECPKTESLLTI